MSSSLAELGDAILSGDEGRAVQLACALHRETHAYVPQTLCQEHGVDMFRLIASSIQAARATSPRPRPEDEEITTLIGLTMSLAELQGYIEPTALTNVRCTLAPVPVGGAVDPSVRLALELKRENGWVFDPAFVGDAPPRNTGTRVHYVSYQDFVNELRCATQACVQQLLHAKARGGNVQLWITCFSEQQGLCFSDSSMWVSLLALPDLARALDKVRLVNMDTTDLGRRFLPASDAELHLVIVDDATYSGQRFLNRVLPVVKEASKNRRNVHIHLITPFTTRNFLLKSGTPQSAYRLWAGQDILLSASNDGAWAAGAATVTETLSRVRDRFPQLSPDEQGMVAEYVTYGDDFTYLSEGLAGLRWRRDHLHIYTTFLMDSDPSSGKCLTTFYFAHRNPGANVLPPYKRHTWTYRGIPIKVSDTNADIFDSREE